MSNVKTGNIKDLKFDLKNANKHTEKGNRLLEKSISKLGLGRSVLVDKDNILIAGNGVTEKCGELGLEKTIIVETDGTELIVVKRKDVSINSKKGRELAIADNQTAKAGIEFDFDMIEDLNTEFDMDLGAEWELGMVNFGFGINDIEEIDSFNESVNFTIKCKDLKELELLQSKLGIMTTKLGYDKFIGIVGL